MPLRRRTFLAGSAAVVASLSGCSNPLSSDPTLGLALYNYTDDAQRLQFELLREDATEHGGALAFDREFQVPSPEDGESAGVVREPAVAPLCRYVARVQLWGGRGEWNHHHYFPGESSTDDDAARIDVRVYRDEETDELYTRFF